MEDVQSHNLTSLELSKDTLKDAIIKEVNAKQTDLQAPIITIDETLSKLLDCINPIDYQLIAFPRINEIRDEIESLKPFITNEDGSLNKENLIEIARNKYLNKLLNGCNLGKKHYLVITIEQLIEIAKSNKWGLCRNNNFIYLYNGSHWTEIDKERFEPFLGAVALKMGIEKFTGKHYTFKEELFKQFMASSFIPAPKTGKDSVLINLLNGTFEITPTKTTLRDFEQKDFITHQLPFPFLPEATAPLFQKYLDEVLPDKEKQRILAEFCGYIFIKPSVLKLEKMLILYGTGANGKSVFFEIINALLGIENTSNYSLQSLTDVNGYYRAKIGNKLVNYASELNGKLATDIFKQLASGEPIEARLPYGNPFVLHEYAKLIFNCNELPKDVEHTNAYFRRFLIIGFDVTITEANQDKQLPQKIVKNELSGVFNWILQGLERVLIQKGFSKCDAVDNARREYEKQSDSVKLFIDEFEYATSSNAYTLIAELYLKYKTFAIEDGYRPVGKSNFMKRLSHYKIVVNRISVGNVAYITTQLNKY